MAQTPQFHHLALESGPDVPLVLYRLRSLSAACSLFTQEDSWIGNSAPGLRLVAILSIVALTLVLWQFEKVRHRRAIRAGFRKFLRHDESSSDDGPIDDPYGVGMNDKDIL
jgi:hypothetical protein